jgi:phosphoglycerate kinase
MKLQEISKKIVGVRVCYDIPNLTDIARLQDSLNTIRLLLSNQNSVVLLTHWGRPSGIDSSLSTLQLEETLHNLLPEFQLEYINQYHFFEKNLSLRDIINISNTKLFLLENTRFDLREQSKNQSERDELAQKYGEIIDIFVDEAFPVSHRKEVTNFELAQRKPTFLGLSYQKEIQNLSRLTKSPKKPFVVIMGGSKLETKLHLIENMCKVADSVLIGGQLAFTFLEAVGSKLDLKNSYVEKNFLEKAKEIVAKYPNKIILPIDLKYGFLKDKELALDIGSESIKLFSEYISRAQTLFWNGPLGYYEDPEFRQSTLEIAQVIAVNSKCFSVIGGGDTVACVPENIQQKFGFVSMGGGSTLDFLAKK